MHVPQHTYLALPCVYSDGRGGSAEHDTDAPQQTPPNRVLQGRTLLHCMCGHTVPTARRGVASRMPCKLDAKSAYTRAIPCLIWVVIVKTVGDRQQCRQNVVYTSSAQTKSSETWGSNSMSVLRRRVSGGGFAAGASCAAAGACIGGAATGRPRRSDKASKALRCSRAVTYSLNRDVLAASSR